jgi:hypothetical protein
VPCGQIVRSTDGHRAGDARRGIARRPRAASNLLRVAGQPLHQSKELQMNKKKLRLDRETLRNLHAIEMHGIAGGIIAKPATASCLACSAYPYICITVKPNGDCPILG